MGLHQSKQKNKSAQSAGPTFSQNFPTQVSPHYIQLDPIYYDLYLSSKYVYNFDFVLGSNISNRMWLSI